MKSDNSIIFNLLEDKLCDFEELVKADVQAFIQEDLNLFYQPFRNAYGDTEALAEELLLLVQSRYSPTSDSWVFIDEWAIILFEQMDISTANKCRDLLYYLFTDFENSKMLNWICERFELSESKLFQTVKSSRFFDWFKLWIVHQYPNIALFLLKKEIINPYLCLKDIELKKVVFYLPKFMFWNIYSSLKTPQNRFLVRELAAGKNIRNIEKYSMCLTKKMAHYFTNAPKAFTLNAALWYGIVFGLNGNMLLFKVFKKHFDHEAKNLDFLKTLVTFFVNAQTPIEAEELSQLLGYLNHLLDEQDEFSIKGWTLNSLRRKVRQWQEEREQRMHLGNIGISLMQTWKGANYLPYETKTEEKIYKIVQLNSVEELFQEGKDMQHCVGIYAHKCLNQKASIWSLREVRRNQFKRLVTIEVNKDDKIVQARTKSNALPKKNHQVLIQKWAILEGLKF